MLRKCNLNFSVAVPQKLQKYEIKSEVGPQLPLLQCDELMPSLTQEKKKQNKASGKDLSFIYFVYVIRLHTLLKSGLFHIFLIQHYKNQV